MRNGSVPWKSVWADDDRLATKRSFGGSEGGDYEHQQYYLHNDLQGSTNVVTDDTGKVFEHWEYFPGGEPWIREDSNVHRTPWLYGGGYLDEVRELVNFGARWYEPREGMFYSPGPDAAATTRRRPSTTRRSCRRTPTPGSSPISYVDPDGYDLRTAGSYLKSKGFGTVGHGTGPVGRRGRSATQLAKSSPLWGKLYRFALSDKADRLAGFSDRWEAKPLVSITVSKGADGLTVDSVKLSPFGFGIQKEVYAPGDDQKQAPPRPSTGAPAVGPGAGPDRAGLRPGVGRQRRDRSGQRGRDHRVGAERRRARPPRGPGRRGRRRGGRPGRRARPAPAAARAGRPPAPARPTRPSRPAPDGPGGPLTGPTGP